MFQFQHLLLMSVATLVTRDTAAVVPQFYRAGVGLCMYLCAGRNGRRICVGSYSHATQTIHCRKARMCQVHSLAGQRQQMPTLDEQRRTHGLLSAADSAVLVLLTGRYELAVQFRQATGLRNWHPVVPSEIACFRLDPALLLRLVWRAELRFEAPVRTKSNKPCCLFPSRSTQDLLHGCGGV